MNCKLIDLLFTVGIIAKVAMLSFVMAIRKMRLFILTGGGEVSAMAIFYFPHWIPTAGMILTFYMGWE